MKKSTLAAGFLAALFLSLTASCETDQTHRPLLWYAESSFPFELTLSSSENGGETLLLTGERTPSSLTLSVTSPERMQGLTVRYENGNCILSPDGGATEIPLSPKAAEGLTGLLDGLLVTDAENAKLGTDENGNTTAAFPSFTLVLDENGLPQSILDTETGRTAEIRIQSSDVTNKDQQQNEYQNENNGGDFRIRPDP